MRSIICSLVFTAAALCAADVDAKPRRVVVLEFDGPRKLADNGRSAVMSVLGDQYNIVATKNWDAARARSAGRGPQQWRQASKQAGVDAVIEGWVQPEGKHHVLTVAVREASTGRELDTLSVRIKEEGVTTESSHKLAAQLDDLLSWIDGDINADPTPTLPDIRSVEPMLGARDPNRGRRRLDDDRGDEAEEDEDRPRRRRARRDDRDRDDREERSRDDRDDDRDRDRDDRDGDDRDRDDRDRDDRRSKRVAFADETTQKDTNDLVKLFGPESKEAEIVSEGKTKHAPKPTPRFMIAAGPYLSSRGLTFNYDQSVVGYPPEYPAQPIKGFQAGAAVYPMPAKAKDGDLSGVGFSFNIGHSVASHITAAYENGDEVITGDYTVEHLTWDVGAHYRWPIDYVAIDIHAAYGGFAHGHSDLPDDVSIPETSYKYLGAGANIDLKVTEGTTVGFGARYLYLLSAGEISDQTWYGAGTAWGAALDANFVIPIHKSLYVKGAVEYKRVKINFDQSGELADQWAVSDVVDSAMTGSGYLGVRF